MNAAASHEFGSQDTDLKLSIVEQYLRQFSVALTGKFPELWYIDAFAGTGTRTVRVEARDGSLFDAPAPELTEQRRGSAQIAVDIAPPFSRLVFVEKNANYCAALHEIRTRNLNRKIDVIEGDANSEIVRLLATTNWRSVRAVMFLDPYGMEVEWTTLEAISKTQAIDLWYLFSLSGLYRQAAKDASYIDPTKRVALNRMLGTDRWQSELYSTSTEQTLFGSTEVERRNADVRGLERYVKSRLEEIFPVVLTPLALPIDRRPQRFSLFFAISNPDPRAIGPASRIAGHILNSGSSSQVRPR
jgi:three-Cys-motif partner protein